MKQGKQISAVLFGVLAVFQMFIVRYMMNNAALTGVPIMVLAEIAAAPVFAAACVWLFSRDGVLSPVGKKVLAGSALFYLLFIAVYYDLEVNLILSGLSTLEQELANGLTPGYLGMAAKVVLLVLAVGFAVTAPKPWKKKWNRRFPPLKKTSAPKNWTAARNSKRRSVLWI